MEKIENTILYGLTQPAANHWRQTLANTQQQRENIRHKTTPYYRQHFASCAYNEKLTYQQRGETIKNIKNIGKNRKRNIIWFNPTCSKSLKANIGKYFFRLLNAHFPPGHKLYKIFNKSTLKPSYSCMSNLKAIIDGHNKKILENTRSPKTKLCNCLKKKIGQWDELASLANFYTTLE